MDVIRMRIYSKFRSVVDYIITAVATVLDALAVRLIFRSTRPKVHLQTTAASKKNEQIQRNNDVQHKRIFTQAHEFMT